MMSLPGEEAEEVAGVATAGLMGDDHLDLPQQDNSDDLSFSVENGDGGSGGTLLPSPSDQPRRCRYLPPCNIVQKCKGSIHLAFLSHACFISASLFYTRLAFVDLAWFQNTLDNQVPREVLNEDDDETWSDWASGNDNGDTVQDMRDTYYHQSKILYVVGAALFVFVGMLDWMRYCDVLNIFMILAGAAGVASGLSDTRRGEAVWDCISVHLYLLEAYNLLNREHNYEGRSTSFFRLADICFLAGSILDVVGSYFGLAGFERVWVAYFDIVASFLWLTCSLIDLDAEIYILGRPGALCY